MKKGLCIAAALLATLALSGCQHEQTQAVVVNHYLVEADLNVAAQSAASSLNQLAAIDKSAALKPVTIPFSKISSPSLAVPVAVSWYGPIQPLLARIANQIGYQLQVYGKAPVVPVLVDIDTSEHTQPAKVVLANVDLQAGQKATILVFPMHKIISLRYMST